MSISISTLQSCLFSECQTEAEKCILDKWRKKKKLRCTKGSQDLSVWLDARRKYENVYCYFDDFSRRLKVIVRMCFPRDIYNAHPVLLYRILCTAFERVWQNEERKQWLFHSVHSIFNGNISLFHSIIVCRRCLHRWCASFALPGHHLSSAPLHIVMKYHRTPITELVASFWVVSCQ